MTTKQTAKPETVGTSSGKSSYNRAEQAREAGKLGGRPRGSKNRSTLDREAYLRSLVTDPEAAAAFGNLTPMDVVKLYMWRMIERGRLADAMEAATRLMPYSHGRIGVVQPDLSNEQRCILDEMANDGPPRLLDVGQE